MVASASPASNGVLRFFQYVGREASIDREDDCPPAEADPISVSIQRIEGAVFRKVKIDCDLVDLSGEDVVADREECGLAIEVEATAVDYRIGESGIAVVFSDHGTSAWFGVPLGAS